MGMNEDFTGRQTPERRSPLVDVSTFVKGHGQGLCNLVDIIDDCSAIAAVCDLVSDRTSVEQNPNTAKDAIDTILDALERVPSSEADRLARHWGVDIGKATLWYGARLSDFQARLRAI